MCQLLDQANGRFLSREAVIAQKTFSNPDGLMQADSMNCFWMAAISAARLRFVEPSSFTRLGKSCDRGQNYTSVATSVDSGEMIAVSEIIFGFTACVCVVFATKRSHGRRR